MLIVVNSELTEKAFSVITMGKDSIATNEVMPMAGSVTVTETEDYKHWKQVKRADSKRRDETRTHVFALCGLWWNLFKDRSFCSRGCPCALVRFPF